MEFRVQLNMGTPVLLKMQMGTAALFKLLVRTAVLIVNASARPPRLAGLPTVGTCNYRYTGI